MPVHRLRGEFNLSRLGIRNPPRVAILVICGVLARIFVCSVEAHQPRPDVQQVNRAALLEAMRAQRGYNILATTNAARFTAGVLLTLAGEARAHRPNGPPLFISHEDWYQAYLQRADILPADAPIYVKLGHEYGQDMLVEYRASRVIRKVERGPQPELAMNVKIWWPGDNGGPEEFAFHDTLSTPNLRVTNKRVILYRLLDFGDMFIYDEIRGIYGRPTSGLLGLLFRVLGEGRVVESRTVISEDGLQITRAGARKGPFGVTNTVTVQPDGTAEKGLPEHRPDLKALEARLRQRLEIDYVPFGERFRGEL